MKSPGPEALDVFTLTNVVGATLCGCPGCRCEGQAQGPVPTRIREHLPITEGTTRLVIRFGGKGKVLCYADTVLTDGSARTYQMATRLQVTGRGIMGLTLSLEGQRQEPEGTLTSSRTNVSVVTEFMIELKI